jgi:5-methylcytosine-specific restriction endonuclease McrA
METKVCKKCGYEKALNEFSNDSKKLDGLFNTCKECEKERRSKWDTKNKEQIKSVRHKYNMEHKQEISNYNKKKYYENPEYMIKKARQYTIDKKEIILKKKRKYYAKNRQHELNRCKKWAQENPEKACQKVAKRNAIKKALTIGKVDYTEIIKRDGYICHICGGEVNKDDVHFDHVIPLSKGGSHSMDNIKVSHSHCNLVKFNKIIS